MTSTFRAPAFEVRCGKSFNLEKFLRGGGILILEGGPGVSFDAMRTIMGAVILKVIDYVRNRSRPEPRVRLVIDEAANADLLGMFECRAMAETQKMGLDFSVLVQNLNFGNSAVTDGVLQNCLRHEWFYCANEAVARAGAADLGDSSYKDKLMTLSRGVRIVKENRQVFQEYVKPLENLWHFPGLGEQKAKEALRRIRTRREYQDGKLSTSESESDAESTPAESRTSSTCSAADRLRTSASGGSGRNES
jgi:hypothetical protein